MDYKEGDLNTVSGVNHAMSGAKEDEKIVADDKTVPSSPKLETCEEDDEPHRHCEIRDNDMRSTFECYACGKEFESREELDLHVR